MSMGTDEASDQESAVTVRDANRPSRASIRLAWGNSRFQADAEVTPLALLAIGGMVGAILVAVAPIVRAGGRARRGAD